MSVELELRSTNGNFSFTGANKEFLDVEAGRGMEPGDPQFTSKVFAHSLLKQGGTLALEDLKLKEMVYPLKLHAANKNALTALVSSINTILNTPGCQVKWKDEGATEATYFDIASGQLDDEYDFRLGQQNWLKVRMRVFAQPLGYRSPTREPRSLTVAGGASTVTGSAPVLLFQPASALGGDAPALVRGIQESSIGFKIPIGAVAFSLLPNPSYIPWLPAASRATLKISGWTATGASAIGPAQFNYLVGLGASGSPLYTTPNAAAASAYIGQNRVLAIARRFNNATAALISVEPVTAIQTTPNAGPSFNGVAVPAASSGQPWSVIDCGIITKGSLPVLNEAGFQQLEVRSTATIALYGLILLPDNSTCWYYNASARIPFNFWYDGLSNAISTNPNASLWEEVTGSARGAIPQVAAAATAPTFAFMSFPFINEAVSPVFSVQVLERCRYAF